mmetsp:Transcript_47118/g.111032  ORF Transcript_47118/g.111032 Transcript_47118/m.111032 type:complete len:294 (-) Transcript_47118:12-893(-)
MKRIVVMEAVAWHQVRAVAERELDETLPPAEHHLIGPIFREKALLLPPDDDPDGAPHREHLLQRRTRDHHVSDVEQDFTHERHVEQHVGNRQTDLVGEVGELAVEEVLLRRRHKEDPVVPVHPVGVLADDERTRLAQLQRVLHHQPRLEILEGREVHGAGAVRRVDNAPVLVTLRGCHPRRVPEEERRRQPSRERVPCGRAEERASQEEHRGPRDEHDCRSGQRPRVPHFRSEDRGGGSVRELDVRDFNVGVVLRGKVGRHASWELGGARAAILVRRRHISRHILEGKTLGTL